MMDKEELYKKISYIIHSNYINPDKITAFSDEQADINKIKSRKDVLNFLKSRYSDIAYDDDLKIHLIGIGGIGSHLAPLLGKIGRLSVQDRDTVSLDNVLSQGYDFSHVGYNKTDAIKTVAPISSGNFNFEARGRANIYIHAVDNMKSRMEFTRMFVNSTCYKNYHDYEYSIEESKQEPTLLIDVRMSPTVYEFFINTMQTIPSYLDKFMFHDKDATPTQCGAALKPQLSYVGAGVLVEYMKRMYSELHSNNAMIRKEASRGLHVCVHGGHFKIVEEPIM